MKKTAPSMQIHRGTTRLFKKGKGRSADSHYPTMDFEDIKALSISEIAAKDCALFMWLTFP